MNKAILIIALLLLAGCASRPVNHDNAAVREHPERYLVLAVQNEPDTSYAHAGSTTRSYANSNDYSQSARARKLLKDVAREYQLESVDSWPIPMLTMQCVVFKSIHQESTNELVAKLQHDPRVLLAQPLQSFATNTSAVPSSPSQSSASYQSLQQSLRRMDVDHAHHWSRGKGIRIAVIDTGLDATHPDLKGRISEQRNFVDNDQAAFIHDRHGTAVGGIIAADASDASGIVGVSPEATLIALKACWQLQAERDDARCNTFTLAKALASAIELRAHVINLSVIGPDDALLAALVRQAQQSGIIVVGAADNQGSMKFPSSLPGVISVTSMEQPSSTDTIVSAPGRDVLTLLPGGRYDFSSGNSIATAEISGTVALLLASQSTKSTLNSTRLQQLLLQSTEVNTNDRFASVNACRALSQLLGQSGCEKSIDASSTANR